MQANFRDRRAMPLGSISTWISPIARTAPFLIRQPFQDLLVVLQSAVIVNGSATKDMTSLEHLRICWSLNSLMLDAPSCRPAEALPVAA
jgi:hypothetical protein